MLYAVMDRGRSDFERFGAVVPRVRPWQSGPGFDLAAADSLGWAKADEATLIERLADNGET